MPFPSTDTFGTLIDETLVYLEGFGSTNDQVVELMTTIDTDDTSFTVDLANEVSRGLIEIDGELMWVHTVSGTTVNVPLWGRGYKGTTAAAHSSGAAVHIAPTWPRSVVRREVNNTVVSLFPSLFAVAKIDLTNTSPTYQFELDATTEWVLDVEWKFVGDGVWYKMAGWDVVSKANTTDFPSGKYLMINEPVPAGALLTVTTAKVPTKFTAEGDAFTACGLPATTKDVVVLGTAARLMPSLDLGRSQVQTVSADALDQPRPLGAAVQISREVRREFERRREEERQALRVKYPIRARRSR